MNREQAEKITTEYMKPIYGFALKRCATGEDAEDLTQEICLKLYRVLLVRDDIEDTRKFVWTVAHNALANYYRGKQQSSIGVCIDDFADVLPSNDDVSESIIKNETESRLHSEIAYLSKLQRRIVIAYYYENKKQDAIANGLGIPLGTVKWHLFEAKKDLKKGMNIMRQASELKFNPIKFDICGTSGSVGTKGGSNNFFRSALSQNIEYAVWKQAKTVNEIADDLGVSPVYVESEAEYLEEYGFLTKKGDKYLCNILLDEPTTEMHHMHDEMYGQAAKLFANALFDELFASQLLEDENVIVCNRMVDIVGGKPVWEKDKNFMLWSLIPYIAALSGEAMMDKSISFEEACTVRPDGGQNICHASVLAPNVKPPIYFESMLEWCGPMWNSKGKFTVWQIDSEWSAKRVDDNYQNAIARDLALLQRYFSDDRLSEDEYAYLAERGYVRTYGEYDGEHFATSQIVWIRSIEAKQKLLAIGDTIKENHKSGLDALKAPFVKAVMDATPKQLRKMKAYGMQYIFYSDGWFILHCMKELVENGKLKLPTEEQKKALTTVIVPNK